MAHGSIPAQTSWRAAIAPRCRVFGTVPVLELLTCKDDSTECKFRPRWLFKGRLRRRCGPSRADDRHRSTTEGPRRRRAQWQCQRAAGLAREPLHAFERPGLGPIPAWYRGTVAFWCAYPNFVAPNPADAGGWSPDATLQHNGGFNAGLFNFGEIGSLPRPSL